MESALVSFAGSGEGSIVDSTMSLRWSVQHFPRRVHDGRYLLLVLIESNMVCTIVSTMANTEEFTVVRCRHHVQAILD
eukprot:8362644-Lingulodinium_polyedra.AAC.1